jgi:hypothetical protein
VVSHPRPISYDPGIGWWVYVGTAEMRVSETSDHAFDSAYGTCVRCGISQREAVGSSSVRPKSCTHVEIAATMEWVDGPRRRLVTPADLWRRWKANRTEALA